jgi:hypothetical protein
MVVTKRLAKGKKALQSASNVYLASTGIPAFSSRLVFVLSMILSLSLSSSVVHLLNISCHI